MALSQSSISSEHTTRIDQLYTDLIELDGKIKRCYSTFKVNIKELAYRYEMAITQDKAIDLPIGFIFDQIVTKLKNKGFSDNAIRYVYEIFNNDPDMERYRRKDSRPKQGTKEEQYQDNSIKILVSQTKEALETIRRNKQLLNEQFIADRYNPKIHNPEHDINDYRQIKDDESLIGFTSIDDYDFTNNALNDDHDPNKSLFESEDEYFNKKSPHLDGDNLPEIGECIKDMETNDPNAIRVKDASSKPVQTATSKAYAENIKSRQRFLEMLLHNPIKNHEIDERYAMLIDLDTRRRNMMTDDKSSHDLMQWLYIQIERFEQSINSASSKSGVPGFITGKYRRTTREQITGKEVFLLKEALNVLNNREGLEIIEAVICKNLFKPRVAEFHNERHENLSESSFGISSFMP